MGLSYAQIKQWRSEDADLLADAMNQRVTALQWVEDDLRRGGDWGQAWTGSHGEQAASHTISALGDTVTDMAATATAIRRLAAGVADAVHALHQDIIGIENHARQYSYAITDNGEIVDLNPGATVTADHAHVRRAARIDLQQSVHEVVAKGRIVEEDAAAGLTGLAGDGAHDGGAGTVDEAVRSQMGAAEPPAAGTDPMRVNMWWESLSSDEQDQVKIERGDQIRNLAGIDTATRDELNRAVLASDIGPAGRAVDEAQERLDAFRRNDPAQDNPGFNSAPGLAADRSQRAVLRAELEDAVTGAQRDLDALLRMDEKLQVEDSFLIEYNDSTPQLQAIYAVGDPDKADNVAVTTPGYTTNVHDSMGTMADEAAALRATAEDLSLGQRTAAIAFIGYQAPQDLFEHGDTRVANPDAAEAGARSLATTMHGVQATNGNANLNLSLFGHSYGSTTAGLAAQMLNSESGTPVDQLALYGSPGVPLLDPDLAPAEAREASHRISRGLNPVEPDDLDLDAMGLDPSRAYYMENDGDVVSGLIGDIGELTPAGLGNKPSSWGMTQLSTDNAEVWLPGEAEAQRYDVDGYNEYMLGQNPHHDEVGEHSTFPKHMTTSQYNLSALAAGRPDLVIR